MLYISEKITICTLWSNCEYRELKRLILNSHWKPIGHFDFKLDYLSTYVGIIIGQVPISPGQDLNLTKSFYPANGGSFCEALTGLIKTY